MRRAVAPRLVAGLFLVDARVSVRDEIETNCLTREELVLNIRMPVSMIEKTAICANQISVAGIAVRVVGIDEAAVALPPILSLFQAHSGAPDIEIRVDRVDTIADFPVSQLFDSGALWHLREHARGYQF